MSDEGDRVRFQLARTEVMSMCLRCGALVGDEDRHQRFHDGLSELIKAMEAMIMFGG